MEVAAVSLDAVTVRARAPQRGVERPTPGSTERNLAPEVIARLPIDASDLNTLATLAPGVVGVGETDSTSAALSVAGQRSTANNITLDGLSFGSGNVPQDALRTTRVVTSTYDVARGQFSGGLVASTTRSGTNVPQGSFTYGLRDRDLAWGGVTESPFDQGYTQNQLSGGMGGPIVPNRLFVFGSLQGRWRGQALPSLVSADPPSLERLGVSPDSAARFLALAGATGVPMTVPALPGDRATDNSVALLRLDWNLSDAQTVMLRLDGRWSSQDPTRVSPLALPATGGTRAQRAGGAMASLSSHFGEGFINEVRGYVSTDRSDATGFLELPEGRVQVGSSLSGTGLGRGIATLAFGGNPGFPQRTDASTAEVTEELSWLSAAAGHRLKLGLYLNGARQRAMQAPNQYGTFVFQSLDALAAGQPAQFTRTLAPLEQAGTAWNGALYLGDIWRAGGGLQLTYGARLEAARFTGAPPYNPAVDSLFGVHTVTMRRYGHNDPDPSAPQRDGVRPGVRRAARVARLARRPATGAWHVHRLRGRGLRPRPQPVRVPGSQPGGHAALRASGRSESPGLCARRLDCPRDWRAQPAAVPGGSALRPGARDRLGSAIRFAAAHARVGRLHGAGRDVPALVHVHARARPVLVLVLRGVAGVLGADDRGRPQCPRVGHEQFRATPLVPWHRHLSDHRRARGHRHRPAHVGRAIHAARGLGCERGRGAQ